MMDREQTAAMLLRFYNMQAGTAFKLSNETRKQAILEALDRADDDVAKIKEHIRSWIAQNPEAAKTNVSRCFDRYNNESAQPQQGQKQEAPVTESQVQYSMGLLEQAVIQLISKTQSEKIESEIMGSVEDKVREFIKNEYGAIERKVTTVVDGKKVPMKGITHEKFETVLKFVSNNEPVYLTGPAGSGKNVICKQVAEALGLDFYFTNAVTQEYKLTGFTDATGHYQETQFYKAFTKGGVFMLDEMDASIPEVLVILNAAIANRYFDFPAPIGYVEAHPNFRVIAAGNTIGHGADSEYVGRNQLDGASLDRFAVIRIDYSEAIENSVTLGNQELVTFCREYRKAAINAGINLIVSYRAMGRLAKMEQILSTEEALETCLIKGLEKDDLNAILNGISTGSKYTLALKKLIRQM